MKPISPVISLICKQRKIERVLQIGSRSDSIAAVMGNCPNAEISVFSDDEVLKQVWSDCSNITFKHEAPFDDATPDLLIDENQQNSGILLNNNEDLLSEIRELSSAFNVSMPVKNTLAVLKDRIENRDKFYYTRYGDADQFFMIKDDYSSDREKFYRKMSLESYPGYSKMNSFHSRLSSRISFFLFLVHCLPYKQLFLGLSLILHHFSHRILLNRIHKNVSSLLTFC